MYIKKERPDWHRLSDVDTDKRLGFCSKCNGKVRIVKRHKGRGKKINWRCWNTHSHRKGENVYKQYRKNICERCGFVPELLCQLDVDHIDNDHNNNEQSNLMTLCANCHRYKTFINLQSTRVKDIE